jgi:hypothetical protein
MKTHARHEAPLPHNNGAKTKRIDLGLDLLLALAPPRAALTQDDIAAWCGCTPAMIGSIEARALRRLREKVRVGFNLSPADMTNFRRFLDLHLQS